MLKLFLKFAASIMVAAALALCSGNAFAQNRSLSGKVVDGTGAPIIGAAVMVAGQTSNGTVTDFEGQFRLTVPANATLIVSCLGYAEKQIQVGNQNAITITLEEDTTFLDETVVIGYGVQRKSDLTGAVASVRQDDLKNRSTADAAAALQGKVAGVQIISNSGAPGSASQFRSSPIPELLEAPLKSTYVVYHPTVAISDRSSLLTASRSKVSSIWILH